MQEIGESRVTCDVRREIKIKGYCEAICETQDWCEDKSKQR
jgi:hypothetical protein